MRNTSRQQNRHEIGQRGPKSRNTPGNTDRFLGNFKYKNTFGQLLTNPSLEDMRQLDAALTRDHKEHVFYTYPNAGHAFMDFTNAQRHRDAAATASWPRTLDFFARHLRGVPVT